MHLLERVEWDEGLGAAKVRGKAISPTRNEGKCISTSKGNMQGKYERGEKDRMN